MRSQSCCLVLRDFEDLLELDPDAYPNLRALGEPLTTAASPDQFEYGLNHLIEGLRPLAKPS